jgi:hypothetical protein
MQVASLFFDIKIEQAYVANAMPLQTMEENNQLDNLHMKYKDVFLVRGHHQSPRGY